MTLYDLSLAMLKGFIAGFLSASVLGYFLQVLKSILN